MMRWKRLPLPGRARLGIILALALLVVFPAYVAFKTFQTPTSAIYQVPAGRWAHWGDWDYTVLLKPNTVYSARELGPDLTYYENLVQGIQARFSYAFATGIPARIEGWYEVTAELTAGKLLSERSVVAPQTPFLKERDSSLILEIELPIDRRLYQERLNRMAAEMGVRAVADATITYTAHVEATAITEAGSTHQLLEPTLIVPLTRDTFTISGSRSLEGNGVIRRPQREAFPGVELWRRYSLLATGIALVFPLLFALFTVARPSQEDPLARQARRLRHKYHKRLAQLSPGEPALPAAEVVVPLSSMEDLARVSEELLKPVIYSAPSAPGGAHIFFILDGTTRYQFRLPPEPPPPEKG